MKIIGVEAFEVDAHVLLDGVSPVEEVSLKYVSGIFADGVGVCEVVSVLSRFVQQNLVDEVLRVTNDETRAAIKHVFPRDTRTRDGAGGGAACFCCHQDVGRAGGRAHQCGGTAQRREYQPP